MKVFSYMEKGKGKDVSEDTILVGNMLLKEGFYFFYYAFFCCNLTPVGIQKILYLM